MGEKEAASLLELALQVGITAYDTAPHYGMGLSEQRMSAFANRMPRIYTKVGRIVLPYEECKSSPFLDSQNIPGVNSVFSETKDFACVWDFSRDGVLRSFEQSCQRLTSSSVYGLRVHDCESEEHLSQLLNPRSGGIWLLREWRQSGKIKVSLRIAILRYVMSSLGSESRYERSSFRHENNSTVSTKHLRLSLDSGLLEPH